MGFRVGLLPDPMASSHGSSDNWIRPLDHLGYLERTTGSQVLRL